MDILERYGIVLWAANPQESIGSGDSLRSDAVVFCFFVKYLFKRIIWRLL